MIRPVFLLFSTDRGWLPTIANTNGNKKIIDSRACIENTIPLLRKLKKKILKPKKMVKTSNFVKI
jgi:hypothetical protein